jgi:hypothetical protein
LRRRKEPKNDVYTARGGPPDEMQEGAETPPGNEWSRGKQYLLDLGVLPPVFLTLLFPP